MDETKKYIGTFTKRTDYKVDIYKQTYGRIYNRLEDCWYTLDNERCYVVTGLLGEQWPIDRKTLNNVYNLNTVAETMLKDGETVQLNPRPSNEKLACFIAEQNQEVKTSWGDILKAQPGDVIAYKLNDEGKYDPTKGRVINSQIFEKTYQKYIPKSKDKSGLLNEKTNSQRDKIDYSRNYYGLKYNSRYNSFSLGGKKIVDSFRISINKDVINNKQSKIYRSYSARDNCSKKFEDSEFYELMLENLNIKNTAQIVRNVNHFQKIDINWDEYYGRDNTFASLLKRFPEEYVNKETSVCYIYKPEFRDEQYRYDLYVKMAITPSNDIKLMSLHWGGKDMDKLPQKVWNTKTNEFDSVDKVLDYLRGRRQERDMNEEQLISSDRDR